MRSNYAELCRRREHLRRTVLCAVLASAYVPLSALAQSCEPLTLPAVATKSWDEDTSYEMTVRDIGGGRLRITVVGDILSFDSTRFASLVRKVDTAPGNVAEIVLDGRYVKILEPLALQSGRVRIQAQTVAFEGRGLIALTQPPGDASDGLEINTMQLDMRRALPVPWQVSVANGSQRKVIINTGKVLTQDGSLQGSAAYRWLWRRSSNFDGVIPSTLPPTWQIDVGDSGMAKAIEAMRPSAAWPAYTAYKLRKFHALAPFNSDSKKDLGSRIEGLRPVFQVLQRGDTIVDIDTITLLMAQNVDRRGFGPAYVPSEDLVAGMTRFKQSREDARKRLPDLRTLILTAHQTPQLNVAEVERARQRIQNLAEGQARRRAEIGDTFTAMAVLEQQASALNGQIEVQREVSRQRLEELKEKDADLANIKIATTVVAVGVSFIGTPAAGAAFAAGVGAVGDVVYAHNAGQPLNAETLVSIGTKNAALFEKLKSAREAWTKHANDLDTLKQVFDGKEITPKDAEKPLTKSDAASLAGKSGGEFFTKLKDAVDSTGSIPKPDSVTMNGVEKDNAALQQHLADLATVQGKVATATERLKGLQALLTADEAALAETRAAEQVLLELKPANDQEIIRWKTAALQLWGRELQRLYQDAMDLRRSLYFETWKSPTLPADVLAYPEEFTAYLAANRYSPENPNATSPTALTEEHLTREISKHMAVLDAIAGAVDDQWNIYKAERAAGATPWFDAQEVTSDAASPPSSRLFMGQLNAQIKRQIDLPNTRQESRFPLFIPFDMTSPPDLFDPERLLVAGVAEPQFADPKAMVGKEIRFDITYRLAGELRRNGVCSYVDLSVPGGRATATRSYSAGDLKPMAAVEAENKQTLTFENLRASRTAPPARTLYFISVNVGGSAQHANWSNVPEIKSFKFWRSIIQ